MIMFFAHSTAPVTQQQLSWWDQPAVYIVGGLLAAVALLLTARYFWRTSRLVSVVALIATLLVLGYTTWEVLRERHDHGIPEIEESRDYFPTLRHPPFMLR